MLLQKYQNITRMKNYPGIDLPLAMSIYIVTLSQKMYTHGVHDKYEVCMYPCLPDEINYPIQYDDDLIIFLLKSLPLVSVPAAKRAVLSIPNLSGDKDDDGGFGEEA